jgi:putative peptide zinc metalloprotease protein
VVWLPDEAHVRAGTDGFVQRVSVPSGTVVRAGQALVESVDPVLAAETAASAARLAELNARLDSERFDDRAKAELTREAVRREEAVLARLEERSGQLVVHSKVSGRFVADRAEDLPGRFYTQGQLFGFVTQDDSRIVRFVVTQQDVELVLNRLRHVEVRLRERVSEVYPAKVIRAVPAADDRLPSAVLSSEGGGTLAADPRDPKSGKALQRVFQFDLALPATFSGVQFGGRTYVRLVLEPEPLARQWYRRLRQLFLERFSV